VINAILANVFLVNYVALTCDEVNIVDNGNWISIHTCDAKLGENSQVDFFSKGC